MRSRLHLGAGRAQRLSAGLPGWAMGGGHEGIGRSLRCVSPTICSSPAPCSASPSQVVYMIDEQSGSLMPAHSMVGR